MTTHDRPFGRHFEDFVPGDVYKHWPGKTITEYDDHLFCLITMNHHPLHLNEWFAENETVQGKNVVVGNLVYSLVLGPERAGRERRGHRQPRDRVAAPRQAHLPRRHHLRRHQGARGQGDLEGRPGHRHRGDQGDQPAWRGGLLLPPQADGVEAGPRPAAGLPLRRHRLRRAEATPVRRRTRRLLLGAGAVPVAFAVLLGVEVQMARSGPDLADDTPLDHDGHIGGDGAALAHGVARRLHRRGRGGVHRRHRRAPTGGPRAGSARGPHGPGGLRRPHRRRGRRPGRRARRAAPRRGAREHRRQRRGPPHHPATTSATATGGCSIASPTARSLVLLGVPGHGRAAPAGAAAAGHRRVAGPGPRRRHPVGRPRTAGPRYVDIAGETGPEMRADAGRTFAGRSVPSERRRLRPVGDRRARGAASRASRSGRKEVRGDDR